MMLRCSERLLSASGLSRMTLIGFSLARRRWEFGHGNGKGTDRCKAIENYKIKNRTRKSRFENELEGRLGVSERPGVVLRDGQLRRIRGRMSERS
jgi:hypothetical protein